MKTFYSPRDPADYDKEHRYAVIELREGVAVPFILKTVPSTNEAGNVAEEHSLAAKRAHKFRNQYYFMTLDNIKEMIPLPREYKQ